VEHEGYAEAQSTDRREGKSNLMGAILDRDNLNRAYKQVKRNRGAAGINGMTVEEALPWRKEHKGELLQSIREGSYRPSPVRRKEIPKPDGGVRKLGIPTVVDRVIQQAIAQKLQCIWEPLFLDSSYGYRPKRSAQQAMQQVKRYNEFDWEMDRRNVKMVRYADDIVVFARSKRAAERLLESCRRYLEGKLKLRMNTEKSKVTSIFSKRNFKFLGFCLGKNGKGIFICAHCKSLKKAKEKLKLLTKRNRGRNVRVVMQEVKRFIRGWLGYFRVADMKRTMQSWDEWLRRRFRMYIWKQWKKPKTKVANLRKLGIPADKAFQWENSRRGYWRIAGSAVLQRSITNERLAAAGYFSILNYYESLHLCA
jgi:hypothetical protein